MHQIIENIVNNTKKRVEEIKDKDFSCEYKPKNFLDYLRKHEFSLIAEIKPSVKDVDVKKTAFIMEKSGANAISVLTEPTYFKGSLENFEIVRKTVDIPILRKDFIINEKQIYESLYYGADSVLLIAPLIKKELEYFISICSDLGMIPLVECHEKDDIRNAVDSGAEIIGINNRSFDTLEVDINKSLELVKEVPEELYIISESGISSKEHCKLLYNKGVNGVLIGTAILKAEDMEEKIKELKEYK